MAKFCGRCGSRLDEQTGQCPNCTNNNQNPNLHKNKESRKAEKKQLKKEQKQAVRAAMSTGRKIRRFLLKLLLAVFLLAVLAAGITGVLAYYDIIELPIADSLLVSIGFKEDDDKKSSSVSDKEAPSDSAEGNKQNNYEVQPPDADAYFKNNSKVISETNAEDSDAVHTEAETCDNLTERGFTEYPITTEYSMDGEYSAAADISDTSSSRHPIYQTYYMTESGDIWTIFEINGVIMANPVSYNLQSDLDVQLILSETDSVTSYDSTSNKFYETIPNKSSLIVKTVRRIDAETLEQLTLGEIDQL